MQQQQIITASRRRPLYTQYRKTQDLILRMSLSRPPALAPDMRQPQNANLSMGRRDLQKELEAIEDETEREEYYALWGTNMALAIKYSSDSTIGGNNNNNISRSTSYTSRAVTVMRVLIRVAVMIAKLRRRVRKRRKAAAHNYAPQGPQHPTETEVAVSYFATSGGLQTRRKIKAVTSLSSMLAASNKHLGVERHRVPKGVVPMQPRKPPVPPRPKIPRSRSRERPEIESGNANKTPLLLEYHSDTAVALRVMDKKKVRIASTLALSTVSNARERFPHMLEKRRALYSSSPKVGEDVEEHKPTPPPPRAPSREEQQQPTSSSRPLSGSGRDYNNLASYLYGTQQSTTGSASPPPQPPMPPTPPTLERGALARQHPSQTNAEAGDNNNNTHNTILQPTFSTTTNMTTMSTEHSPQKGLPVSSYLAASEFREVPFDRQQMSVPLSYTVGPARAPGKRERRNTRPPSSIRIDTINVPVPVPPHRRQEDNEYQSCPFLPPKPKTEPENMVPRHNAFFVSLREAALRRSIYSQEKFRENLRRRKEVVPRWRESLLSRDFSRPQRDIQNGVVKEIETWVLREEEAKNHDKRSSWFEDFSLRVLEVCDSPDAQRTLELLQPYFFTGEVTSLNSQSFLSVLSAVPDEDLARPPVQFVLWKVCHAFGVPPAKFVSLLRSVHIHWNLM